MKRMISGVVFVVGIAVMVVAAQQKATKPKAETKEAKIARALSAGPANIAKAAKVVDRDENGKETVLREGHNGFTCFPGHPWVVDDIAYCANADALQWEADWHAHRPKPTNNNPVLITCWPGAPTEAQPTLTQLRESRSPKGLIG